jgi:hypothetical protein
MPWLPDVARLERAWLDSYHAADAEPLAPKTLASIPPERLGDAVLKAHPAARIVRSRFPAVTIFAANRGEGPVGRIEQTGREDALVTRPAMEVAVRRLPRGGAAFLTALLAGQPLGAAAGSALADHSDFDLSANIAGMLQAGVFAVAHPGG